jgi:hypothetical protein
VFQILEAMLDMKFSKKIKFNKRCIILKKSLDFGTGTSGSPATF